jgi:hypothetical protein
MSKFDENDSARRPSSPSGYVAGFGLFSVAAFLVSVTGAQFLSKVVERDSMAKMIERDSMAKLAYERSMRHVVRNAEEPQTQVYSVVRSVGVDGMMTATIPLRGPAPVSPCGDDKPKK